MAYKIAVASSDGIRVDLSFGAAESFYIYEVDDDNQFYRCEKREYSITSVQDEVPNACNQTEKSGAKCAGKQEGCRGSGCGGQDGSSPKIALIEDCRCVLCSKLGFQIRKQLEKKAITVFDINYEIDTAIEKIAEYYDRMDHHKNLRGL